MHKSIVLLTALCFCSTAVIGQPQSGSGSGDELKPDFSQFEGNTAATTPQVNPTPGVQSPTLSLEPSHVISTPTIGPSPTSQPQEDEPYLLFANRDIIYRSRLNGSNLKAIFNRSGSNAIALDYDFRSNSMFWTDVGVKQIIRAQLDGTEETVLIDTGLTVPDGLAWDWTNQKLYWTDAIHREIEVLDLQTGYRKKLIDTGLETIPRGMALDPGTRWLYWTDWGAVAKIEKASMDGSSRIVLHNTSLLWPNAVTIDYESQTLYWADANLDKIESSHVDGSNRVIITTNFIFHPFSIVFFKQQLYWSDWAYDAVLKLTLSEPDNIDLVAGVFTSEPMGVHIVAQDRQPEISNPCSTNNGNCSHLCLLSAMDPKGYTCSCPNGFVMSHNKINCTAIPTPTLLPTPTPVPSGSCLAAGYTSCCESGDCLGEPAAANCFCDYFCFEFLNCCPDIHIVCASGNETAPIPEPAYLIFANRERIVRMDLNGTDPTNIVVDEINAVGLDFDYRQNLMYWTDVTRQVIRQSTLNGSGATDVVSGGLDVPDGIAVDWISHKIYWTDATFRHIEVFEVSSGYRKTVILTGSTSIPRAIVVDSKTRWMYWSDWGDPAKIERASMDGMGRVVLHNTELNWPNALTIDYATQLLYWADANLDKIESSNTDGTNRILITRRGIFHPFAMTAFEGILYWTDWGVDSVISLDVDTDNVTIALNRLDIEPMGIQVISQQRQRPAANPCLINNGNCSHLCLLSAVAPDGYSCACPNGAISLPDQKTCIVPTSSVVPIITPTPAIGSCIAAGYDDCCLQGGCEGEPEGCFCDSFCFELDDCCHDFTDICPGDRTTSFILTTSAYINVTATTVLSSSPAVTSTTVPSSSTAVTSTTVPSSSPAVTSITVPSSTPAVTSTRVPSSMPAVTSTTVPSSMPAVTSTTVPSSTPAVTSTRVPSSMPAVTSTTVPSSMPAVTSTTVPSSMPAVTSTTVPSSMPAVTSTTVPSSSPAVTSTAVLSSSPAVTSTTVPSSTPAVTSTTVPSSMPAVTSVTSIQTSSVQPTDIRSSTTTSSLELVNDLPIITRIPEASPSKSQAPSAGFPLPSSPSITITVTETRLSAEAIVAILLAAVVGIVLIGILVALAVALLMKKMAGHTAISKYETFQNEQELVVVNQGVTDKYDVAT